MEEHGGLCGPRLQTAMFERGETPDPEAVEEVAVRLRRWFADGGSGPAL
jgi:hypothetical protein